MSFTRKMLKAMGIEEEKIDQIIDAHIEVVDSLKEQRDNYKTEADKVPDLERQINEANTASADEQSWKIKYDDLKKDFDQYKDDIVNKEKTIAKENTFRELLKQIGVSEKHIDSVLKVSNLETVELDDDGKIKDVDDLSKSLKEEWSDFIVSKGEQGASTATPPSNTGVSTFESMSLNDKMTYANSHPDAPEVTEWLNK